MVAGGDLDQSFVGQFPGARLGVVTALARRIHRQIGLDKCAVPIQLIAFMRVDRHQVRAHVGLVQVRRGQRVLAHVGHVTVHTRRMATVVDALIGCGLDVTGFAVGLDAQATALAACALVRVMAIHTVHDALGGEEQLVILLIAVDKALGGGFQLVRLAPTVTGGAGFRVALHGQAHQIGVVHVITAGAVTGLAAHAVLGPRPHQPRQAILVANRHITGGVTLRAGVILGFAGMERHPRRFGIQAAIPEVVLRRCALCAGDQLAFLVDKQRLPGIAAHHIADVLPGIALGRTVQLGIRVLGRFAIHHRVEDEGVAGGSMRRGQLLVALATRVRTHIRGRAEIQPGGTCRPHGAALTHRADRAWRPRRADRPRLPLRPAGPGLTAASSEKNEDDPCHQGHDQTFHDASRLSYMLHGNDGSRQPPRFIHKPTRDRSR